MYEVIEQNGAFTVQFGKGDVRPYASREAAQDAVEQKLARIDIADRIVRITAVFAKIAKGEKLTDSEKFTRDVISPVIRAITSDLPKDATDDDRMDAIGAMKPEWLANRMASVSALVSDIGFIHTSPKLSVVGLDGSVQSHLTRLVTTVAKAKESATVTRDKTADRLFQAAGAVRNSD